ATASEPPSPATREPAFQASAAPPPQAGAGGVVPPMPPPGAVLAETPLPSCGPPPPQDPEDNPGRPRRRPIARPKGPSLRPAPPATPVFEVDVSRIVAHRERRQADFQRQGVKLTYTPYFVQAAVAGLQAVPSVNGSYAESGIVLHQRIHIGVAVALEEGLIVPVIRDADEKNLLGLARAVNDLAERARSRRLQPDETQGGTLTRTKHRVAGRPF